MKKTSFFVAIIVCSVAWNASACDMVALTTNMKWAYDNNDHARQLIQEGVLAGTPAQAVKKISEGYKVGQAGNSDTYKELDRCGPIDIIKAAKSVVGI